MRARFLSAIAVAAIACAAFSMSTRAESATMPSDAEVNAHEAVLDLAGAFTNDGFKLRDGNFTGTLKNGESKIVQVNLYAGNQYWFSVATADPKTTVSIALYDESGKAVKADPYSDAHRAAAGFSPDNSGPFYVKISNAGPAATFCLIYSYK
jgi:hypothetical protein